MFQRTHDGDTGIMLLDSLDDCSVLVPNLAAIPADGKCPSHHSADVCPLSSHDVAKNGVSGRFVKGCVKFGIERHQATNILFLSSSLACLYYFSNFLQIEIGAGG